MRVAIRILIAVVIALHVTNAFAYDVIRVRVTTTDGDPIPSAKVTLAMTKKPAKFFIGNGAVTSTVNREGRVEFLNPMEGTYAVSASAPGFLGSEVTSIQVVSAVVVKPRVRSLVIVLNRK